MRVILGVAAVALATLPAMASARDVYVQGHVTSNGTYVQGHWQSAPNDTTLDNWSTKGNVNPYTGQEGTRNPTYNPPVYTPPVYQPPRTSGYHNPYCSGAYC